jgi:hypothetical protein
MQGIAGGYGWDEERPRGGGRLLDLPRAVVRRVDLLLDAAGARRFLPTAGALVAIVAWTWIVFVAEPFRSGGWGPGQDARAYWVASPADPYAQSNVGGFGSYLYSPAFLQVIAPLKLLSWRMFLGAWTAILMTALAWLTGPRLFLVALVLSLPDIAGGNIHLLLAVAIVVGMRWPGAWAFLLLTKLSPGIALLWFLVRREWHHLAIAIGVTVAVATVSVVLAPAEWPAWIGVLLANASRPVLDGAIPFPFPVRLPIGVALLVWGARTNRPWVVPVSCLLAVPVMWFGSLTILAAVIPLSRMRHERPSSARAEQPARAA